MASYEDMELLIQEWLAEQLTAVDLAKVYAVLRVELDRQLEICMNGLEKEEV